MRILVYKRTHNGDPDANGCFGAHDCMGAVRAWEFDAVIGVGGMGEEAEANGISGKVNWIGIGPRKVDDPTKRGPLVTFDQFRDFGTKGPEFQKLAPNLARRIYDNNIRTLLDDYTPKQLSEAMEILYLAEGYPASPGRAAKGGGALTGGSCKPKREKGGCPPRVPQPAARSCTPDSSARSGEKCPPRR